MNNAIAIVGMGVRYPNANNLERFWHTLRQEPPHFVKVPRERWDHSHFYSDSPHDVGCTYAHSIGSVEDIYAIDTEYYGIARRQARYFDPQQRMFLDAARMAIEDAGFHRENWPYRRTGVYLGISVSEQHALMCLNLYRKRILSGEFGRVVPGLEKALDPALENLPGLRAHSMVGQMLNMGAASVARSYDLCGPVFAVDAACASSLVALTNAVMHLRTGMCDAALVGGVYAIASPDNLVSFARIGALSAANQCRPFDERADGFVLGEGVGAVVLRRLSDALRDGNQIWAVIRGVGITNDGHTKGPMTPMEAGQVAAIETAYRDASLSPSAVGWVEAHGTATRVGDAVESAAMAKIFGGPNKRERLLTSVKANVGHTLAAAGMASLVKVALGLREGLVPAQANFSRMCAEAPLLKEAGLELPTSEVSLRPAKKELVRAGISAFGFGGTNVHVVLEEAPAKGEQPALPARVSVLSTLIRDHDETHLFVLSAPKRELLARHLRDLARVVKVMGEAPPNNNPEWFVDLAGQLASRRYAALRVAILAASADELAVRLERAALLAEGELEASEGVFFAAEPAPEDSQVVFLFPGQGAQRVDMGRDLRERFPRFAEVVNDLLAERSDILDALYSKTGVDLIEAQRTLMQTENCQLAMAAYELALGELAAQVGLAPQLSVGHSLGEWIALAHAGALSSGEAMELIAERSRLMAEVDSGGAMLAIAAGHREARALVETVDDVWLANINHPRQVVLAGRVDAVERVKKAAQEQGLHATRLPVSHAFHTPLFEGMNAAFRRVIDQIALVAPETKVVSAVNGQPVPEHPEEIRALMAQHGTSPVRFADAIRTARDAGGDIFVQVGAGSSLLSMVRQTLAETESSPRALISLAAAENHGGADFLEGLASAIGAGLEIDLCTLYPKSERPLLLPPSLLDTRSLTILRPPSKQKELPALEQPIESTGGQEPSPLAKPELMELFRRQLAVMSAQISALSGQGETPETRALGDLANAQLTTFSDLAKEGRGEASVGLPAADPQALASKSSPEPFVPAASESAEAPPPAPGLSAEGPGQQGSSQEALVDVDRILQTVAQVAATTPDRIRLEMSLVDDLGFDSLMAVELAAALVNIVPSLSSVPQEIIADGTVADLVAFLSTVEGSAPSAAESQESEDSRPAAENTPLAAYRVNYHPQPIRAPLSLRDALAKRKICVVTRDVALGAAVVDELCAFDLRCQVVAEPGDAEVLVDLRAIHASGPLEAMTKTLAAVREHRRAVYVVAATRRSADACMGFVRALGREWTGSLVRGLSFAEDTEARKVAECVVQELLCGDDVGDVRVVGDERLVASLSLANTDISEIPGNQVVLISGGGGGVGGRLAKYLAARHRARIVLVGRRPLDEQIAQIIDAVEASGGRGIYLPADITCGTEVEAVVQRARSEFGPLQYVVHAAGISVDRPVEELSEHELLEQLRVKIHGAEVLWRATVNEPITGFALIGSWAGRYGNAHQSAYSAANRALAGLAEKLDGERAGARVVTVALPLWAGTPMTQRLPQVVIDGLRLEGVPIIDEDAVGCELIARELLGRGTGGELLVGVEEEIPVRETRMAWLDADAVYLRDHQVLGVPVLPLAYAIDSAVVVARSLGFGEAVVVRNLAVLRRVEVSRKGLWVRTQAERKGREGHVELACADELAGPWRVFARGGIAGNSASLSPVVTDKPTALSNQSVDDYYQLLFHGPAMRAVVEVGQVAEGFISGAIASSKSDEGMPRSGADLKAVDGCLQLCGFVVANSKGGTSLPTRVAEIRVSGAEIPSGARLLAAARLKEDHGAQVVGDVDLSDASGTPLVQMRGVCGQTLARVPRAGGQVPLSQAEQARAPLPPNQNQGNATPPPLQASPTRTEAPYNYKAEDSAKGHALAEVPAENHLISHFPEVVELTARRAMISAIGLVDPYFPVHSKVNGVESEIGNRSYINYSSYNYVGLCGDADVNKAAQDAIERYGTSVSASRIASGERPFHQELEKEIASFLGCEDSIVMVGGHATNVSVIGHLLGPQDVIVHDSLAHDSILGGALLSGARRRLFPHNDMETLDKVLNQVRSQARRLLIAVEGGYSMDGDLCPLPQIIELKKKYRALLFVDEAHSMGVVGATGRGVGEHFDVLRGDVELWMGTFSKSLASCGGYIAGSQVLIDFLKYTTPGFIYSVGISPANAAAALAALRKLQREPDRIARLQGNSRLFLSLLKERGLNTGFATGSTPIVPCIVGNSGNALKLAEALGRRGINVQPIMSPAVEEHFARLRFFITSNHQESQLRQSAQLLAQEIENLSSPPPKNVVRKAPTSARWKSAH